MENTDERLARVERLLLQVQTEARASARVSQRVTEDLVDLTARLSRAERTIAALPIAWPETVDRYHPYVNPLGIAPPTHPQVLEELALLRAQVEQHDRQLHLRQWRTRHLRLPEELPVPAHAGEQEHPESVLLTRLGEVNLRVQDQARQLYLLRQDVLLIRGRVRDLIARFPRPLPQLEHYEVMEEVD